jgi:hypothetical protein
MYLCGDIKEDCIHYTRHLSALQVCTVHTNTSVVSYIAG